MARGLFSLLLTLCFGSVTAFAQIDVQTSAPPPMKFVSSQERNQIESERDMKKRARLTVELAEVKLARAEQLTGQQYFADVIAELGGYQGLVENVIKFLGTFPQDKNKTRDTYKKLEISLRAHITRIETIRRITPAEYAENLKNTIEFVRDAREKAINSFFDDTVLSDQELKKKEQKMQTSQKPSGKTENTKKPQDEKDKP